MSDRVDNAALEVARGVARASGGDQSPGAASSTATSSIKYPSPSPSGSRTASSGGIGGASSGYNGGNGGGSSTESEPVVPEAVMEKDWPWMPVLEVPRCDCDRVALLKRVISGKNLGQRFFGCPKEDEEGPCQFVSWLDNAWPQRLQRALKDLFKEVEELRKLDEMSASALYKAIDAREAAKKDAEKKEEELERTKRYAERVCARCLNLANRLELNCLKLQFYARCLLGVVVLLSVALIAKLLK